MQQPYKLLATAITAALLNTQGAKAATIVVDIDEDPALFPVGSTACTLRTAVAAANQDMAFFGCAAGSANEIDLIEFEPSLAGGTITLQLGHIDITSSLSINGLPTGTDDPVTISGNNASRIFDINDHSELNVSIVSLANLVLRDGSVIAQNGGAIFIDSEHVAVDHCQLIENSAILQVSDDLDLAFGGAIAIRNGQLSVANSLLSQNSANSGGAVFNQGAIVSLTNTRLEDNSASGFVFSNGGAVESSSGSVFITDSVLTGNTAENDGGAIFVSGSASLVLDAATLSFNQAQSGAALFKALTNPETILSNVTISNNTADEVASAAIFARNAITIANSTMLNNQPSAFVKGNGPPDARITNSVLAQSTGSDCVGPVTTNINNLIEDGSCADGAIDLLTGDPMLGPLQDNGGLTLSHAPLPGSPVIDRGSNADCTTEDQTGIPRPIDGDADGNADCDIGSIEFFQEPIFSDGFE